jgi:ribosomal protein S27E
VEPRYYIFKVTTSCPDCGKPLILNGPQIEPSCPSCQGQVSVDPSVWRQIIEGALEESAPGNATSVTLITAGLTIQCTHLRIPPPDPACTKCEENWDLASVPGATDGFVTCRKCGYQTSTFPAPAWLRAIVPTAEQVFFAERTETEAGGRPVVEAADASTPIVLACPRCQGGLTITAQSERTVKCSYCSVDVFLPDALWLKLHPAKVAKFWAIRFTDRPVVRAALPQSSVQPPPGQPAGLAVGTEVLVQWSDGNRYPGTIAQLAPGWCLVSFPGGRQEWVGDTFVTPQRG